MIGTLEYMAPEQAQGVKVDQRADQYAFGLIFYDMLLGRQRLTRRDNPMTELLSRRALCHRPNTRETDNTASAVRCALLKRHNSRSTGGAGSSAATILTVTIQRGALTQICQLPACAS